MSRIRSKDTKIEVELRKELWSRGLRYRKNVKNVPGKPDIAFIGKKVAVFCDSEFWHGYDWEHRKNDIKTRREFWIPKIERNIQRDLEVNQLLEEQGWIVLRFWGKEIQKDVSGCADRIEKVVRER
ncbi:DNA mismatch endonuclease Vsr [Methanomassiliicoccaceae archaeon DOK]|nr:DNA mismatch endonuclease Vsr [Methanomassiliicoccaceae archaeon DOK]